MPASTRTAWRFSLAGNPWRCKVVQAELAQAPLSSFRFQTCGLTFRLTSSMPTYEFACPKCGACSTSSSR